MFFSFFFTALALTELGKQKLTHRNFMLLKKIYLVSWTNILNNVHDG